MFALSDFFRAASFHLCRTRVSINSWHSFVFKKHLSILDKKYLCVYKCIIVRKCPSISYKPHQSASIRYGYTVVSCGYAVSDSLTSCFSMLSWSSALVGVLWVILPSTVLWPPTSTARLPARLQLLWRVSHSLFLALQHSDTIHLSCYYDFLFLTGPSGAAESCHLGLGEMSYLDGGCGVFLRCNQFNHMASVGYK